MTARERITTIVLVVIFVASYLIYDHHQDEIQAKERAVQEAKEKIAAVDRKNKADKRAAELKAFVKKITVPQPGDPDTRFLKSDNMPCSIYRTSLGPPDDVYEEKELDRDYYHAGDDPILSFECSKKTGTFSKFQYQLDTIDSHAVWRTRWRF